jgi:ATP-dependent DNA helicase RecG
MSETNRIEYKKELTKELDLEKEVIAFLNYKEGGVIYIGIDKDGGIVGIEDLDSDMLKVKDRLKNNIHPSCLGLFDVVEEKRDGVALIKIIVASGLEKPYFKSRFGMTPKGAFMRIGTAAEPMIQVMIDDLFSKRTRNTLAKIKSNEQDLTFTQLKIYYEEKGAVLNDHFVRNLELKTADDSFNYVGYLLSDKNNTSIKLAKFDGNDRTVLEENNEFGYASLIKATKQVLDKLTVENKTLSAITSTVREDKKTWNEIALREAIINAFVHTDYTKETPPKFEIFNDRIEISSFGGLPEGLDKDEFFMGFSQPRNKELMRVYKDLGLVEQLGSGVQRIVNAYGEACFHFSTNFLRIVFPKIDEAIVTTPEATPEATPEVTPEVLKLVLVVTNELSSKEIKELLELKDDEHFRKKYLKPALEYKVIEMTIPDKPKSGKQKYRLTPRGKSLMK